MLGDRARITSEARRWTAEAIGTLGGPPLLVAWVEQRHDASSSWLQCPRADWLVWLAAADGATDEQLVRAVIVAIHASFALVPDNDWPLGAALDLASRQFLHPDEDSPTVTDLAKAIAGARGPAQRIALAVRSLCKAAASARAVSLQAMAVALRLVAIGQAEQSHPELARTSLAEASALIDRALVWRSERGIADDAHAPHAPVPIAILAALRQLRAQVPLIHPTLLGDGASSEAR